MRNNPLKAEVTYYPYALPMHLWGQTNYWFDEMKMNLLWLVHPEVDTHCTSVWKGDDISLSIDKHLSQDLRALLSGPPIEFMRDFVAMDDGDLRLTQTWPHNYQATMWVRAKEANARLCADMPGNVVMMDFKNKRRFG